MNTAYVEPVTHNSPDRWDALAFMCAGVAIYLIIRALIWVARRGESFWAAREDAAIVAATKAATKTRTYVDAWAGTAVGAAKAQADIDAGRCRARLTTAKPVKSGRLAAVKRGSK